MNLTECNCFPGNSGPDCPGDNPELQVQGWFGILPDLNQDGTSKRRCGFAAFRGYLGHSVVLKVTFALSTGAAICC